MTELSLFDLLKSQAAEEWQGYTRHEFLRLLGHGTLPEASFREYLVQDYLFLIQFSRAYALAAYKSREFADIRAAQDGLAAIVAETDLHVRLCARWGLGADDLEAAQEHQATVAYTRFVLDAGMSGDLLDLHVALSPCVIGYAEIAQWLSPAAEANPDHPYAEWIQEYASKEYQSAARAAVEQIEKLARRTYTEARLPELTRIFSTATRMESAFWQMGLDAAS